MINQEKRKLFKNIYQVKRIVLGRNSERLPVVKKWLVEHRQILGFM